MVVYACDGETVVVCDPPIDQDDEAKEVVRYNAGGFAKLTVRRGDRRIVIDADREGLMYCRVYDEQGRELKNLDVMFDAL